MCLESFVSLHTYMHMYTLTEIQNAHTHTHDELKIYNCFTTYHQETVHKPAHPVSHTHGDLTRSLGSMLHVMFRYACFTAGLLERFVRLWDLA